MEGAGGAPFGQSRGDQALSRANVLTVGGAGFVIGAFFGSPSPTGEGLPAVLGSAAAIAVLIAFAAQSRRALLAVAGALAVVVGAFYAAFVRDYRAPVFRPDEQGLIKGIVADDPLAAETFQRFSLLLAPPSRGVVTVNARRFPELAYGDAVRLALDERSLRVSAHEITARGGGSPLVARLIAVKRGVVRRFREHLPADHAALMGGLLLGDRGGFSAPFRDAMRESGTTHLVALSRFNISLVMDGILFALRRFASRRIAFAATAFAVAAFVLMVGGEPSVVRAAIMGFLLLVAAFAGRPYHVFRSAALAAFVMTAWNPALPRSDLGFQLSFLSLAGIVLLDPVFRRLFRVGEKSSLIPWREALSATSAAQAMVLPLILSAFHSVSPVALAANVFVLPLVPLAMIMGFFSGVFGLLVPLIGRIVAWSAYGVLGYMVSAIRFFGDVAHIGTVSVRGMWFPALYYAGLALVLAAFYRKHAKEL